MKSVLRIAWLCVGLLVLSLQIQAGPKVRRLHENAVRIKGCVLLIAPILPDSFVLKKLQRKGVDEVAQYLDRIQEGNELLAKAFEKEFTFCRVQLATSNDLMQTYPGYFSHLKSLNADSVVVFQFGQTEQFASQPARKIKRYDRDVAGVYATDGKTRLLISPGQVKNMWRPGSAENMVRALQHNLEHYAGLKLVSLKKRR